MLHVHGRQSLFLDRQSTSQIDTTIFPSPFTLRLSVRDILRQQPLVPSVQIALGRTLQPTESSLHSFTFGGTALAGPDHWSWMMFKLRSCRRRRSRVTVVRHVYVNFSGTEFMKIFVLTHPPNPLIFQVFLFMEFMLTRKHEDFYTSQLVCVRCGSWHPRQAGFMYR